MLCVRVLRGVDIAEEAPSSLTRVFTILRTKPLAVWRFLKTASCTTGELCRLFRLGMNACVSIRVCVGVEYKGGERYTVRMGEE